MEKEQFIENFNLLRKELSDYAMELTGDSEKARDLLLETVVRAFDKIDKMPADCKQGEYMRQIMQQIYDNRKANAGGKRIIKNTESHIKEFPSK